MTTRKSRSKWAPILERYLVQNPETAWQTLEGEAVIVTPADSKLHTLNETATFLWQRCEKGQHTVAELVDQLCEEYDVGPIAARRDVCALVDELLDKGMVFLRDAPGVPPTPWDDL